jgi:hypothetical protein
MGNSYGERTLFTTTFGRSIQVSADGNPKFKAGGVTIDWSTVPAVGANASTYYTGDVVANGKLTFEDNVEVFVGEKVLRYGSIVTRQSDGTYRLATDAAPATPVRGETFIVNETWLETDVDSNHPGVIDGGRVFRARLLYGGAGQPSVAEVEAAMPGILYVTD